MSIENPRARWGDRIVDCVEYAAREWSTVLHPTPRTTWVAPLEGWDRNWPNRNTPPDLWGIMPGDTVPPGLDVFVTGIRDERNCFLDWSCATGSPVQPPGGHLDIVRMGHLVVDSRHTDPENQKWLSRHEFGHVIAISGVGKREWSEGMTKLPLSPAARLQYDADSVHVQTHPVLLETYREYGGGAWKWIGKGIGVSVPK